MGPSGQSGQVSQNSLPPGIRPLDLLARCRSQYRLSYPGPHTSLSNILKCWVLQQCSYGKFMSHSTVKLTLVFMCRSQWPRGLRRRSAASRLLKLFVRIPSGAWLFFCCECCVLSGRGLCVRLITHPEESYRMWCVVVCDLETSRVRRLWPALGRSAIGKGQKNVFM
jgi:hypothetical protein